MPFIPTANAARICVQYQIFEQQVCNIWWFEKASAPSLADLTTLGIAVNSFVVGEIMPHMASALSFRGVIVRDMSSASAPQVDLTLSTPVPGGVAVQSPPANVTAVIKFLTGLAGRSFRGRAYLPGLPITQITGNAISSAFALQFTSGFNDLDTYLAGTGWEHIVCSQYSGVDGAGNPIPRAAGVTTPITGYAMDLFTDSQRRRLTGRGN